MLSVNPRLTWWQVKNIIESTAQNLPNYPPNNPSRPNWNNQVGYGLVNAHEAVQEARCIINLIDEYITGILHTRASCGDMYARNITVTNGATLTLMADGNIHIRNITVQNGSRLITETRGEVFFDGDFYIQLGSQFEMR